MLSVKDINLLQAQNDGLIKQNKDLQAENKDLKKYIERMDKPEIQVIDAEILTLKEENAELNAIIDGYQPRLQALKDIKDIIKNDFENKYMQLGFRDYDEILENIKNKITKAEEE